MADRRVPGLVAASARRRAGVYPGLLGLLAGLAVLPGPARAETPPSGETGSVEFRWDAPAEGCPDEAAVLAELEHLLGGPVSAQGQGRLAAIARVRRERDGSWDLRLWTVSADATRQRSMTGQDCSVLAEAAVLLAAMAIDPSALERATSETAVAQAEQAEDIAEAKPPPPAELEPEPPPPAEPEPEPAPEPPSPAAEPEPPPPTAEPAPSTMRRRFDVAAGLAAGVSAGALPSVGPVLRGGLGLVWDRARLELDVHYAFVRRSRFDDAPDLGADLRMATAMVRGCGVLRHERARLEFPICVGVEAGALLGAGVGFVEVDEGAIPWLALDLSPGLAWVPIDHLAVGLRVEPYINLLRSRFEAEGFGEIWRPRTLGLRAVAGLEARF